MSSVRKNRGYCVLEKLGSLDFSTLTLGGTVLSVTAGFVKDATGL